jgi:hypothetical protein
MATMTAEQSSGPRQLGAARFRAGRALSLHIAVAALTGFVVTAIWAFAGPDRF